MYFNHPIRQKQSLYTVKMWMRFLKSLSEVLHFNQIGSVLNLPKYIYQQERRKIEQKKFGL